MLKKELLLIPLGRLRPSGLGIEFDVTMLGSPEEALSPEPVFFFSDS